MYPNREKTNNHKITAVRKRAITIEKLRLCHPINGKFSKVSYC
jgi:hypothetical protein